jgi:hypothetical protein
MMLKCIREEVRIVFSRQFNHVLKYLHMLRQKELMHIADADTRYCC